MPLSSLSTSGKAFRVGDEVHPWTLSRKSRKTWRNVAGMAGFPNRREIYIEEKLSDQRQENK
jgi:hypothetical protein